MIAFCIWLMVIVAIGLCVRDEYPPANFKEEEPDTDDEDNPYDGSNGV